MPIIVNGLLRRKGEVLLAHRSPQRRTYPDTWSFPGGHVEPGETLDDALKRELIEEIGVTATHWSPVTRFTDGDVTFHIFTVTAWRGTPQLIGDEHIALRWMPPADAAAMPGLTFQVYARIMRDLI